MKPLYFWKKKKSEEIKSKVSEMKSGMGTNSDDENITKEKDMKHSKVTFAISPHKVWVKKCKKKKQGTW